MNEQQQDYNLIVRMLPTEIKIGARRFPLVTWTSRAIDVLVTLDDKNLSTNEKMRYAISRLTFASIEDVAMYCEEIYTELMRYLQGPPTPEYEVANLPRSHEPIIYWNLDSPAIVASFRQAYGISLEELQKMHFWEFRTLLFSIPADTRLGLLFATRSKVIDPKLKGEDRRKEAELKKSARPKDKRTLEEKEKGAMEQLAGILG